MQLSYVCGLEYETAWDFRVSGANAELLEHQKAVIWGPPGTRRSPGAVIESIEISGPRLASRKIRLTSTMYRTTN
jgi:hypothetical protein